MTYYLYYNIQLFFCLPFNHQRNISCLPLVIAQLLCNLDKHGDLIHLQLSCTSTANCGTQTSTQNKHFVQKTDEQRLWRCALILWSTVHCMFVQGVNICTGIYKINDAVPRQHLLVQPASVPVPQARTFYINSVLRVFIYCIIQKYQLPETNAGLICKHGCRADPRSV